MNSTHRRTAATLSFVLLPLWSQGADLVGYPGRDRVSERPLFLAEHSKSVDFAVTRVTDGRAPNRQNESLSLRMAGLRQKIERLGAQMGDAMLGSARNVNSETAMKPYNFLPSSSYGSDPLNGSGGGFGFDDLYQKGAKVAHVYAPFDDGYRVISMKLYAKKNGGEIQTMIGIVDITPDDPTTPYAPKLIPLTQSGQVDFQLQSGGRRYTLRITMSQTQHNILLSRQGARDGTGAALSTSIEDLARLRADQASEGSLVTVGSSQFYTAVQGGVHGSVLFFPKEYIDQRADILDTRYLRPIAMGDVSKVDGDGMTVRMEGRPDIGLINGLPYHLEFNGASWDVVPGAGDQ